jgi:hypothetical protein
MRAVLIDWLVDVHIQFSMLQETLYLTVAILDRFLQKSAKDIPRKSLQLVGVAAMFIASKYEEMYAPEIGESSRGARFFFLQRRFFLVQHTKTVKMYQNGGKNTKWP